MTVITKVLQLLIPAKLLNSVYKGCTGPLQVKKWTASSQSLPYYIAHNAVLNGNGWKPSVTNQHQWLQVYFGQKTDVTGIGTKGLARPIQWVKTYTISYSDDGTNFKPYMNNKV